MTPERKQAVEAAEQAKAKRPASQEPATDARPSKTARGVGLKPAVGAAAGVVPDEHLPPNKILFIRDLPEDYGTDAITAIFARFSGFREVRLVPTRKGIAFVEYETEDNASAAKDGTAGMAVGESSLRVTFQRK